MVVFCFLSSSLLLLLLFARPLSLSLSHFCASALSLRAKNAPTTPTTHTTHPQHTTHNTHTHKKQPHEKADPDAYAFQPENTLKLRRWAGDPGDTTLLDLIPMLQMVATRGVADVRDVVRSYDGEPDVAGAFKARVAKIGQRGAATGGGAGGGGGGGKAAAAAARG